MKTTFSNSLECMHAFAQQNQTHGKSLNVFFEDTKIYSYGRHYLLAEFKEIDGKKCIIINDKGYSNTTAKHISTIIQATRQYKQYFTSNVDLYQVRQTILHNYAKLLKATKPQIYTSVIISKFESLIYFPLFTTNNKKSIEFKEIQKIYKAVNNPDALNKAKEVLKANELKAKKRAEKKLKDDVKKFYNYEIDYITNDEDFIRISQDGAHVESSQSVIVDVKEAKLLYSMIKANKDIKGHKIGNHTVISINGVLKIGCHNINIESMHKVGQSL